MKSRRKSLENNSSLEQERLNLERERIELERKRVQLEIEKLENEKKQTSLPWHKRFTIDTKINLLSAMSLALTVYTTGTQPPSDRKLTREAHQTEQVERIRPTRSNEETYLGFLKKELDPFEPFLPRPEKIDGAIEELKNAIDTNPSFSFQYQWAHNRLSKLLNDKQLTDVQRGKVFEALSQPRAVLSPSFGWRVEMNLRNNDITSAVGIPLALATPEDFQLAPDRTQLDMEITIEEIEKKLKNQTNNDLFERGVLAGRLIQLLQLGWLTDMQKNKINALIKLAKSSDGSDDINNLSLG